MIKIAVPNKGSLSESALEILSEAGYKGRDGAKHLNVVDQANGVEFFFLRPKDIAVYVGAGVLDMGISGRDLVADSQAEVHEVLDLGFGSSQFRYAGVAGQGWTIDALDGKKIATSYPNLVRNDLAKRGLEAEVIRLDGAVEVSIRLGVADAIADVVSTGATLRQQGLEPFGEPIIDSEAVVIKRQGVEISPAEQVVLSRIRGILNARNFLMLDFNVAEHKLAEVSAIAPGMSGPTVSPLAREGWVAVRVMVPCKDANQVMDELYATGAEAILASELRIARI